MTHADDNMVQTSFEERLTFKRLQDEILEKNQCALCYGCVCFCSANELNVLTIKDDKPTYFHEDSCIKCGICHLICPRTQDLDNALKDRYEYQSPIGHYEVVRHLRAKNKEIQKVCCDGGAVTAILKFLLDTKRIDGAIVSKKVSLWNNEPMLATKFEDLLECAGSSLTHSTSIRDMGDLTTYASIFNVFKGSKRLDLTKLAVVGTPCQIQTIRKMQILRIVPSHLVFVTLGLFCYENFLLTEKGKQFLEEKIHAKLEQIKKINLKDNFIVTLDSGEVIHLDLDALSPIVRPACLTCNDFTNFTADISLGGLGSPTGYTTTIARSPLGYQIVNEAIAQGYMTEIRVEDKVIEKLKLMDQKKLARYDRIKSSNMEL